MLADPVVEAGGPRGAGIGAAVGPLEVPTEVEPVRSAEPLIIQGTSGAIAFCTWFDALRVAIPFASASNVGMSRSQPSGSSRRCMADLFLERLVLAAIGGYEPLPRLAQFATPGADALGEVLADLVRDQELARPRASRRSAWSRGPPPRRAARRGRGRVLLGGEP